MPINQAAADELLSTTRAVRKRLDLKRPVPRDVIVDCVRISQQAPTGSNKQGWRWMIVDDADKRAALAKLYRDVIGGYFEKQIERARAGGADEAQTVRVYESAIHLRDHLHEVPVHVIPCIEGRPAGGGGAGFFASIYPAVWSFNLALRARGLGTVLTTPLLLKEREVSSLLGIPENFAQAALLPVAYTIGTDFKPAARPKPESIIHWNSW